MKNMYWLSGLFLFVFNIFFASGCMINCIEKKEKEVKALLSKRFVLGSSKKEVESTIDKIDMNFSYNRFQNHYNSTIKEGCGEFEAITAKLILNEDDVLYKIEVRKSFTNL